MLELNHNGSLGASQYFRSQRLGFRQWSDADIDLAMGLWGDPDVTQLIGGPFSSAQVREGLAREIATLREHGVQYWPAFLLATGEHVGCCGVRPYRVEDKVYELGFEYTHDEYYAPTGLCHPSYLLRAESSAAMCDATAPHRLSDC
jgi:RimJ/RimL family protein N-acetyltransferase